MSSSRWWARFQCSQLKHFATKMLGSGTLAARVSSKAHLGTAAALAAVLVWRGVPVEGGGGDRCCSRFEAGKGVVALGVSRLVLHADSNFRPRGKLLVGDQTAQQQQGPGRLHRSASEGTPAMHAPAVPQRSSSDTTNRFNHPGQNAASTDAADSNASQVTLTQSRWGDAVPAQPPAGPERCHTLTIPTNK